VSEYDIFIDVNNDGTDDFVVVGVDLGAVTAGAFNGQMAAFVFNLSNNTFAVDFFASAPTDSTTLLLPVRTSRLPGLSKTANPRFTYKVASFAIFGTGDDSITGTARFNAWSSSISQGQFSTVNPGSSARNRVDVNHTEWPQSPPMGLMIVTQDNMNGAKEADLIPVRIASR
jgi:hypothetical protein